MHRVRSAFATGIAAVAAAGFTVRSVGFTAAVWEFTDDDVVTLDISLKHAPYQDQLAQTSAWMKDKNEDPRLLWRHARACYRVATSESTDKQTKQQLLNDALAAVKKSLALNRDDPQAHRWMGTVLQEHSSTVGGYKQQITDAFTVKSHWQEASTLDPNDATCHHLLGRWCFTVTDMPWYQRKVASALFATPPSSTYEEALTHFQAAEHISPGFWKANQYYIALCYQRLNQPDEATTWARSAALLPVQTEEDKTTHDKVMTLLKKLSPNDAKEVEVALAARHAVADRLQSIEDEAEAELQAAAMAAVKGSSSLRE